MSENFLPEVIVMPRGNYLEYSSDNLPDYNTYVLNEIQKARINAAHRILDLDNPLIPIVPRKFGRIIKDVLSPYSNNNEFYANIFGTESEPLSCIYNATSMYDRPITGNITFSKDPMKYGFEETDKAQLGDFVQLQGEDGKSPHHMMIVTGFDINGKPVLSYAKGSYLEGMMKDNDNWDNGEPYKIYTFVGNKDDERKWKREYNSKKKWSN